MTPVVFNYSDPRIYLVDTLAEKQKRHPQFSLRAWSQQMGFKNHTSLVFFLQGKRSLRPQHADTIVKGLKITPLEEEYFRALIQLQSAQTQQEKNLVEQHLKILKPAEETSILEVERFKLIADWLHMALLEMTKLSDFNPSSEWIEKRLHFKASEQEINEALNRLLNLKLLKKSESTIVKTNERLTTSTTRSSESIREHHRQVLNNAIHAIESQTIDERIFNSCTMTVRTDKLKEASALILKFREEMTKLMEQTPGDETYQLSVQFYKLTDKIKKDSYE